MKYADGTTIRPGDIIRIDTLYRGRMPASMDTGEYLPDQEVWAYPGQGIMAKKDYGGPVRDTTETAEDFVLVQRGRHD